MQPKVPSVDGSSKARCQRLGTSHATDILLGRKIQFFASLYRASIAQWQSVSLVNWRSWAQSPVEADPLCGWGRDGSMTSDRGLWDSSSSGSWHRGFLGKPSSHGSKLERARRSQESNFLIRRKTDQGNAGRVEVRRSCRLACCRAVPSSRESAPHTTLKHTQQQK